TADGFEVVGDVKWLSASAGNKIIVSGSVTECSGDIILWGHTIDLDQRLDTDEKLDDDLELLVA
ncbi:MAG: hypothetical protein CMB80_07830, partial [Flammeovirgaceae bacterium]|nr:hypothetical protein [Flammeovirgaceae bacterium]